jgi:ribosomal-protein-alanine N-acetyltransferase
MAKVHDASGRTMTTERLHLRPFAPDDVDWYAAIRAKPEVVRYLPGGEATAVRARPIAEGSVAHFVKVWDEVGYGPWAVIEQASGRPLGHAGVRWIADMGETEVLYMLDTPAWGRGYATEAAIAARDYAFEALRLERLIALAVAENVASIAVMGKLGMAYEGVVSAFGLEAVRYAMSAPGAR